MSGEPTAEQAQGPQAPRKSRMLLLVVVAVFALLALIVLVQLVVRPAVRTQEVANAEAVDTRGLERAAWCDSGRFAVIQDFERDGTPVVTAWNRDTGRTESQRGWLWLRTEQAAAAIWMVPMSGHGVRSLIELPGPTPYPLTSVDTQDSPAPGLARWVLDSTDGPSPATVWEPIPAGMSLVAVATVDPGAGSAPSDLRLVGPHRDAKRPLTVGRTFEPLAWAATGEVFGIQQLFPSTVSTRAQRGGPIVSFYSREGTRRSSAGVGCWSGATPSWVFLQAIANGSSVIAQDVSGRGVAPLTLLSVTSGEGAPSLLGPAGKWVLIGVNAAKGARQYDEITAPGERKRVLLVPRDPTAEWTQEAWREGAGLLRLGLSTSATGQLQTRVMLYKPGVSRPKTIYKGPKRLTTEGNR